MTNDKMTGPSAPWWKHGMVWMLIAGPAAVIVAGVATTWIAVSKPDPLVAQDYYRRGIEINKTLRGEKGLLPAMQGRNHAVSPPPPAAGKP